MLTIPIQAPYDLLIAILLIVFGGFLGFGFVLAGQAQRQLYNIRLAQMSVMVLCALAWWLAGTRTGPVEGFSRYVFLGAAFSLLGDSVRADSLRRSMGLHALGYLWYMLALHELHILFDWHDERALTIALVLAWVIAWGVWAASSSASESAKGRLAYALLAVSLAAYAAAMAAQFPALLPVAVGGGLLFAASTRPHHAGGAAWHLYIFGQTLMVFTNATVLSLSP